MFPRNSADKYDPKKSVTRSEDAIYDEFLEILQDVERTSRPISFETLDIVAGNREAEKVVAQLIGREVDEKYRYRQKMELEDYLMSLQRLAEYWQMISERKYYHRKVSHAIYDGAIAELVPHGGKTTAIFHYQTLRSSCIKPFARNASGKIVTKAGKEYF